MTCGGVHSIMTRAIASLLLLAALGGQGARMAKLAGTYAPKCWPFASRIAIICLVGVGTLTALYFLLDGLVSLVVRDRRALTKWLARNYADVEVLVRKCEGKKTSGTKNWSGGRAPK